MYDIKLNKKEGDITLKKVQKNITLTQVGRRGPTGPTGPQGPKGDTPLAIQPEPPFDEDFLWIDTDDETPIDTSSDANRFSSRYTIKHFPTNGSNQHYYLTKVYRKNNQRIIKKELSFGVSNADQSVANRETITNAQARLGVNLIFNASAWTPGLKLRGVQIKDGVILQNYWESEGPLGTIALCSMGDGSIKIYDSSSTAQEMIDDGVMDSWSHTAALVRDGILVDNSTHMNYLYPSAMNVAGCDVEGNYMFLQSYGISGSSGYTMQQIAAIAYSLGFYQAVSLDGGGSTQSVANGSKLMPSSDGSPRPVPDFITINADIIRDSLFNEWKDLTLNAGAVSIGSNKFRLVKGEGVGRGYLEIVINISGGVAESGVIAVLPIEARPEEFRSIPATSNAGVVAAVGVNTNGNLTALNGTGFNNTRAIRLTGRIPLL